MSNVVPFDKTKNIKSDQPTGWQFIFCAVCAPDPNQPDPGFAPLVCFDKNGPIVTALVCLGCESQFEVNCGRLVT